MTYSVIEVQKRLKELGYYKGSIDGVEGPLTRNAIVRFKRDRGLRARPFIGPITYEALFGSDITEESTIPWFAEAMRMKGLHERRNRTALVKWFDKSVSWIDPRTVPWCGAFVASSLRAWNPQIELPENPLGARNFLKFGQECKPQLGALMIFWRGSKKGWKGHIGFYYGEDSKYYYVLGGNQSNAVTITRISKHRLLGARWPNNTPINGKVIRMSSNGIPITTNET